MTCDPSKDDYCCTDCPMDMDSIILLSILIPVGVVLSILLPCAIKYCVKRIQVKRLEMESKKRYEEMKKFLSGYVVCKGIPYGSVWVSPEYDDDKRPVLLNLSKLPEDWLEAIEPPRTPMTQFVLDQLQMIIEMNTRPKPAGKKAGKGKGEKAERKPNRGPGVSGEVLRKAISATMNRRCCNCKHCQWSAFTYPAVAQPKTPSSTNPQHAGYDQPDYKPSTMLVFDQCWEKKEKSPLPEPVVEVPPPNVQVSTKTISDV